MNLCESLIGMDGRWGEREETVSLSHERNSSFRTSSTAARHVLEESGGGRAEGAKPQAPAKFHAALLTLEKIQRRNRP